MGDKIMVSEYQNVLAKNGKDVQFEAFIAGIRDGKWQDIVLDTRIKLSKTEDKKERRNIKAKNPLVRISGSFSGQNDKDIRKHSGYIAIDLDDVENPNSVKKQIGNDSYVYAAFISISGNGLCLIFKIDGSRHLDAFNGISKYLYENYQLIVDQSGKNVSRARFVSYDPHIHINEDAVLFKKYLPKPKVKKQNKIVYVESDLDRIVTEIYNRGINLCEDYSEWISICYALCSQFGDSQTGRDYFNTLSSLSSKYNPSDCEKQYNSCLKTLSSSKQQSTINSIYHHAKVNGIEIYSKQTKDIIRSASSQYRNGVDKSSIAESLKKYNEIPESESCPVIDQVISQGIEHESENIIDDIMHFLMPFGLRKNLITRNVEINGKPIDDSDINTLFIDCKSLFDKATKDLVCSVVFSNKIDQYNPIKDFFESEHEVDTAYPNLKMLLSSIITDTSGYDKWVKKWLVSVVASAYGNYSPLVLVFSGQVQGTGKTHWMRYLLPKRMRYLFAESKMDNGKDDEILMTKKLIILDDEYGGKSKREEKKLKEITAKEFINVREPYGRVSVDLRRLSVFCGTTNEDQIISDPTGNRRVLPINIISIDHSKYNAADKVALWHEIYHLYKSGFDYTVLKEDIQELNENTDGFTMSTAEEDLIAAKLSPGTNGVGEWMNITTIINYLTLGNNQRLSNTRLGMVLSKSGYEKKRMWMNGNTVTAFFVNKVADGMSKSSDEPPF